MNLSELKKCASNGDVLLVKSESTIGKLIRVFTGESYSHVAVLLWTPGLKGNDLIVSEFVEGVGHQSMSLAAWMDDRPGQIISYGVAPDVVRKSPVKARAAAEYYRTAPLFKRAYGYLSLAKVWLSQLIRCRIPVRQKVCSTFAQEIWRCAGFDAIGRTADPGDIAENCQVLYPIWR